MHGYIHVRIYAPINAFINAYKKMPVINVELYNRFSRVQCFDKKENEKRNKKQTFNELQVFSLDVVHECVCIVN